MTDWYDFETTPNEENCVQVKQDADYLSAMKAESNRMVAICKVLWPSLYWRTQMNPHDFGSYASIRCIYDDENEDQSKEFMDAERHWPQTWEEADRRAAEKAK
jgi:hypothetical protein